MSPTALHSGKDKTGDSKSINDCQELGVEMKRQSTEDF